MCKRHWRAVHFPDQVAAKAEAARKKELEEQPSPPYGESVYDNVLPASIAYRPSFASHQLSLEKANENSTSNLNSNPNPNLNSNPNENSTTAVPVATQASENPTDHPSSPIDDAAAASMVSAMPLVNFLRDGALYKEIGWHRQVERRARGIPQCASLSMQLEPWEKQLALVEILLLSGGTPHANFFDLAHAWGREKGFHQVVASSVCTRRGEIQRKKRSDAGKKAGARLSNSSQAPPAKRAKVAQAATVYPPQVLPQQQQLGSQMVDPKTEPQQLFPTPVVPWHQQALQQQQQQHPVAELQPQQHPVIEVQPQQQQSEVQQSTNGSSLAPYS